MYRRRTAADRLTLDRFVVPSYYSPVSNSNCGDVVAYRRIMLRVHPDKLASLQLSAF